MDRDSAQYEDMLNRYKIDGKLGGPLKSVSPTLLVRIWPEVAKYVDLNKGRFEQFKYDKARFIILAHFLGKIR